MLLHLGKFYHPESGGIESVTKILAECAVDNFDTVQVLCFTKSFKSEGVYSENGVVIEKIYSRCTIFSQPLSLKYIFTARKHANNADLIHIHAPNYIALFVLLLIRKEKKIVIHWHSDVLKKYKLIVKFLSLLETFSLKKASAVIATSPQYIDGSRQLQRFRKKVSIIPLCLSNKGEYCIEVSEEEEKHARSGLKKKIVFSVGRLVNYKSYDTLIDAAKHLSSDYLIVIAGSGPLRFELEARIKKHNLSGKVRLLGFVKEVELEKLYAEADVFCLPSNSRAEAFGVVLLEAMSHRVPLLTTALSGSGVLYVNKVGVTGEAFSVGNSLELADKIKFICETPSVSTSYGNAGYNRLMSKFSKELVTERVNQLYLSVLGGDNL